MHLRAIAVRFHALIRFVSKYLFAVSNKPFMSFPLSTQMIGRIREIMMVNTPRDLSYFEGLLVDGSHSGIQLGCHRSFDCRSTASYPTAEDLRYARLGCHLKYAITGWRNNPSQYGFLVFEDSQFFGICASAAR